MPELPCSDLDRYLKGLPAGAMAPVYLIFGEELLYKSALDRLLAALLSGSKKSLNYDPFDEGETRMGQVVERVNTFSLLSGPKVVALLDSKIFFAQQDNARLVEKIREAFEKKEMKKAATCFLSLLRSSRVSLDEIGTADGLKRAGLEQESDRGWIEPVLAHCAEKGLAPPAEDEDAAGILEKAIAKGFPKGNHLVITADLVDKRRSLYKAILNAGVVIDCSVPKGDRRDDKIAQEAVLNEKLTAILCASGKRMEKEARLALLEMTGFDLRIFCQNVEKLVDYVGNRAAITLEDAEKVLYRSRKDPIYELTHAVAERDVPRALSVMASLLSENMHPLQILSAITNQIRKLIIAKGFIESPHAGRWEPNLTYLQFRQAVMPGIRAYDDALRDRINAWENGEQPLEEEESAGRKKKGKISSDLLMAKNPQNAYPVFQTLVKSEAYSKSQLIEALACLSRADITLKTTGQNPRLVLESAIFRICGRFTPDAG